MLVGKNTTHGFFLNDWATLMEMAEDCIYPPRGPNAEAGICLLIKENKVEVGVAYETASGRDVCSFYDNIYLINMDESKNFRSILEEYFCTDFYHYDGNEKFMAFFVDRPLCEIESSGDLGVGMGYFMATYFPDEDKNDLLISIFNYITEGNKIKKASVPLDIFEGNRKQPHQHHYDFYAHLAAQQEEVSMSEKEILLKIREYIEGDLE